MPRNIRILSWMFFLTRTHFYLHVYALILLSRGLTLAQVGLLESVVTVSIFLLEIPTGVVADRVGRKYSVLLAVVFRFTGELWFLLSTQWIDYIIMGIFTGMGFAFASGATEAMIYESLPDTPDREQKMQKAMGYYNAIGLFGFVISPVIGGMIVSEITQDRFVIAMLMTMLALVCALGLGVFLKEPKVHTAVDPSASSLKLLKAGFQELRHHPRLRHLAAITIFTTPFTGILIVVLGSPLMEQNGVPPLLLGVALAVGSLLSAFTSTQVHRIASRLGRRRAFLLLLSLPALMYFLLAAVQGGVMTWLLIVLAYGVMDMRQPLVAAYQNLLIANHQRATTLSLISMFVNLFVAICTVIYGVLATHSLSLTFVVMGTVILLAVIVLRVDKLDALEPTQLE